MKVFKRSCKLLYILAFAFLFSCEMQVINPYIDVTFTYFTLYRSNYYSIARITIPIVSGSNIDEENSKALLRKFSLEGFYVSKISQIDEKNYNINKHYSSPNEMPPESFIVKSETDLTKITGTKDTQYIVYYKPVIREFMATSYGKVNNISSNVPTDSITSLVWENTKPSVAEIDWEGNVIAKSDGNTTICAKDEVGNVVYELKYIVRTPVQGVSFAKKNFEISAGQEMMLEWDIFPEDSTNKNVTFTSSNPEEVQIDNDGYIFIQDLDSKAVITITTEDGGFKDSCNVSAIIGVEKLTLSSTSLELWDGQESELTYKVYPENAKYQGAKFSLLKGDSVEVSPDGKIKTIEEMSGENIVVCESEDGLTKAQCTVSVKRKLKAIKFEEVTSDINVGDERLLKIIFTPANAYNKNVILSSSDPSIEIISGQLIKARDVNINGVEITAISAENPEIKDVCMVRPYIMIKSIEFVNKSDAEVWDSGKGNSLEAKEIKIIPSNSTFSAPTFFEWSSSDNSKVYVNSSTGKITGMKGADTDGVIITCRNKMQKNIHATYKVKNKVRVQSISILGGGVTIDGNNGSKNLTATVLPTNAYCKDVMWASDGNCIKVDNTGRVIATDGENNVTITCSSQEEGSNVMATTRMSSVRLSLNVDSPLIYCKQERKRVNPTTYAIYQYNNGPIVINATVVPVNANITWKCSGDYVEKFTVSEDTKSCTVFFDVPESTFNRTGMYDINSWMDVEIYSQDNSDIFIDKRIDLGYTLI